MVQVAHRVKAVYVVGATPYSPRGAVAERSTFSGTCHGFPSLSLTRARPSGSSLTTTFAINRRQPLALLLRPLSPGFLRVHLTFPLLTVALLLAALVALDGDRRIAATLFFSEATQHWVGRNNFWMNAVLHTGGRNLMRLMGVLAIGLWLASYRAVRLQPYRRQLAYLALCIVLVPLTVGGLKQVTNVDCPWDLQGFGGNRPAVEWFEDRPDGLPAAACFPGAHSSSAFALFSLYFLLLGGSLLRARLALGGVVLLGSVFSIAQQSRGAHFLSHDLVSALFAWLICLGLYLRLLVERKTPDARQT